MAKARRKGKGATLVLNCQTWNVMFRDPRQGGKLVSRSLKTGDRGEAERCKRALDAIIADPRLWNSPPAETPPIVRKAWLGQTLAFGKHNVPAKEVPEGAQRFAAAAREVYGDDSGLQETHRAVVAAMTGDRSDLEQMRLECAEVRKHNALLQERIRELEADLLQYRGKAAKRTGKPVGEVLREYLAWFAVQGGKRGGKPREADVRFKRQTLEWWVEELGLATLDDVDGREVEQAAIEYMEERECTGRTVNIRVNHLRALCNWALQREYLSADPLRCVRKMDETPQKARRRLTREELAALLKVAPADRALAYEVAAGTGYRLRELRALTAGSLQDGCLCLDGEHTKNKRPARQPLGNVLLQKLTEHVADMSPDAPLLVLSRSQADEFLVRDLKAAGIEDPRLGWHSLRKHYTDELVRNGATPKDFQALARHASPQLTLQVYAFADEDRLQELVQRIEKP